MIPSRLQLPLLTAWVGVCLAIAACAQPAPAWPQQMFAEHAIVLLGEVHDNAGQHALRLAAFKEMLARGARPALVMEQFDRERQAEIDRQRALKADADTLIAAAGDTTAGWNWAFYRPFIELALAHDLPIVAANVSRADARALMSAGLTAAGFDAHVSPEIAAAHAADIEQSHCGLVDPAMARRMSVAQAARDQSMARAIELNASRGAVLLAGNGHVRTDVGVPRWLSPATRQRTLAIGFVEQGDAPGNYDRVVSTPRQTRDDPCLAMKAPPSRGGSAP